MEHFSKPSDYMKMTKRQLAYKLAEALSYIRRVDPKFGLFRFQREFADWVGTSGDPITLDKVQCPVPECFKSKKVNKKAVCSYCNIRQDYPDSPEGEAVKLLSRDRGIRIFRTKYGKYYTAREERVNGGKEYFDHTWIDACPKCGRRLG